MIYTVLNISSTHLPSLNQLFSLILLQLSWSGDGKKLLSASADKTAKIWDITAEKASTLDLTLLNSFLLSIEQQCCLSLLFVTCHNTVEVCKLLQIEKTTAGSLAYPTLCGKKEQERFYQSPIVACKLQHQMFFRVCKVFCLM